MKHPSLFPPCSAATGVILWVLLLLMSISFQTSHAQEVKTFRADYLPVGHVRTDPILSQTCLSDHVHTFYGPPLLYPTVTYEDLRASDPAKSSGNVEQNLSLYWHPAVYQVNADGTRQLANQQMTTVYYTWAAGTGVRAFPNGFKMIGGMNPNLSNQEAGCADESPCNRGAACSSPNTFFPTTACQELEVNMQFPFCWDGVNLESDDQSHVLYVNQGLEEPCPSSHPVKLPQMEFFFRIFNYPGGHHEFSDGSSIFHADYIAGWDDTFLQNVLDSGCEFNEFLETAPICNAFPFTYRDGVRYQFGAEDTDFAQQLRNNRVPLANTDCIATEAVDDIEELPRGTCTGTLVSADGSCAPTVPTTRAPTIPTTPFPVQSPAAPPDEGGDDEEECDDEEVNCNTEDEEDTEDEDDGDDGGGLECFSGETTVAVKGRGVIRMEKLKIGDFVSTGQGYSMVYSFGHYEPRKMTEYLQIQVASKQKDKHHPLEISMEHMLYKYNLQTMKKEAVPAGSIKVGDWIVADTAAPTNVLSITKVSRRGAYSPLTTNGDIMVGAILASNYVSRSWVKDYVSGEMLHWLQHGGTVPYRIYCAMVGCHTETHDDETGFSPWVQFWYHIEQWQLSLPKVWQVMFLTLLAVPMVTAMLLGKLLAVAPTLTFTTHGLAAVIGLVLWKHKQQEKKTTSGNQCNKN